ncbi:hypothetical protein CN907_20060 [Bacillus anthracis]|nr:hypothetical protein CN907_20060 [Bacillus anthracis]
MLFYFYRIITYSPAILIHMYPYHAKLTLDFMCILYQKKIDNSEIPATSILVFNAMILTL